MTLREKIEGILNRLKYPIDLDGLKVKEATDKILEAVKGDEPNPSHLKREE